MRPLSLALLAAVALAGSGRAELPPGSYDKLRAGAGEAVTIRVTSVTAVAGASEKTITVEAKVLGVERSKAGLKAGDAVTIRYAVPNTPRPGPRPVPVLVRDEVTPAFLNAVNKGFEPAAYGWSFKMTPEAAP